LLSHAGAEKTGFTIPVGTAVSKRLNRSPAIDPKDDTGHERGLVRDKEGRVAVWGGILVAPVQSYKSPSHL